MAQQAGEQTTRLTCRACSGGGTRSGERSSLTLLGLCLLFFFGHPPQTCLQSVEPLTISLQEHQKGNFPGPEAG